MKIDLDVAIGFDFEIHQAVLCEKREHVVEEGDFGCDGAAALSVDFELQADLGFGGGALDQGVAGAHRKCGNSEVEDHCEPKRLAVRSGIASRLGAATGR